MANRTTRVQCPQCNWRTHRSFQLCECDMPCGHGPYGVCPWCKINLASVETIRRRREEDARPVLCAECGVASTYGRMHDEVMDPTAKAGGFPKPCDRVGTSNTATDHEAPLRSAPGARSHARH